MSALEKIAFFQKRRDEVPNQLLAKELTENDDQAGIAEIADNLNNLDRNISSDCLKVMYEIGYIKPELIAPYVQEFLHLLDHKDNRKVWGAMIALATVADIQHAEIAPHVPQVINIFQKGTLITTIWGTRVLAKVASRHPELENSIYPELEQVLKTCLARDVPTQLESMQPVLSEANAVRFLKIVEQRKPEMSPAHLARLKKALKTISVKEAKNQ